MTPADWATYLDKWYPGWRVVNHTSMYSAGTGPDFLQQSEPQGTPVTTSTKKPTAAQQIKALEEKIDKLSGELETLDEQVQNIDDPEEGMTPDEVREILNEELPDMDDYALKEDLPNMDEYVLKEDLPCIDDIITKDNLSDDDVRDAFAQLISNDCEVEKALESAMVDILCRENRLDNHIERAAHKVFEKEFSDVQIDSDEVVKLLKDPTSAISTAIRDKIVTAVNAAKLTTDGKPVDKAEIENVKRLLSEHASSLGNEIAERQNLKRYTDSVVSTARDIASQRMDRIDSNLTGVRKDLTAEIEVLRKAVVDLKKSPTETTSAEITKLRADLDLENKNRIRQVDARVSEAIEHTNTLRKDVDRCFREDRQRLDKHILEIEALNRVAQDATRDAKMAATRANDAITSVDAQRTSITDLKRTVTTISDVQKGQTKAIIDLQDKQDATYREMFLKAELLRETLLQQIEVHNANMKTINAFMNEHQAKVEQVQAESKPVEMSLKSEASTAGYRIAVRQVTKLVHEPMVARFCQMDPTNASIIKLLASSELGRAALAATMSVGVDYAGQKMTGNYALVAGSFAKELRVSAMSDTADFALDIVMEPLRDVICKAITDRHTGISAEVLDAPVVQEVIMVEQAQACAG